MEDELQQTSKMLLSCPARCQEEKQSSQRNQAEKREEGRDDVFG